MRGATVTDSPLKAAFLSGDPPHAATLTELVPS